MMGSSKELFSWDVRQKEVQRRMGGPTTFCRDCGGGKISVVRYDVVCTCCGLVQETDRISDRAEWRTFSDTFGGINDSNVRCGPKSTNNDDKRKDDPPQLGIGGSGSKRGESDFVDPSKLRRTQQHTDATTHAPACKEKVVEKELSLFENEMDRASVSEATKTSAKNMYDYLRKQSTVCTKTISRNVVMGACLYLASNRSIDVGRIHRIFDIDRARFLNKVVGNLCRDEKFVKRFLTTSSDQQIARSDYLPSASMPSASMPSASIPSASMPLVSRRTHTDGFPLIAQTIVRTAPLDFTGFSLPERVVADRALKTRLKFRCWEIKDFVVRSGLQGSLNPYLFNLGIAIVASEELGIPEVTPAHMMRVFECVGCESTIARNVKAIRAALPAM